MSEAPARGTAPRRQRRHHHKHQKQRVHLVPENEEPEEKRPKVNPIFLWALQQEQRIVEVRCEDYDKRNRIKLTKTAQGWRSIPRTASSMCPMLNGHPENIEKKSAKSALTHGVRSLCEKENGAGRPERDRVRSNGLTAPVNSHRWKRRKERVSGTRAAACKQTRKYRDVDLGGTDDFSNEEDQEEDKAEEACSGEEVAVAKKTLRKDWRTARCAFLQERSGLYRCDLERARKDQMLQPRVVLEQLRLSQLPGTVHRSLLGRMGKQAKEKKVEGRIGSDEKQPGMDKEEDLRDILNMLDVTASPALATDTPSADLPSPNATKTCDDFELALGNVGVSRSLRDLVDARSVGNEDFGSSALYSDAVASDGGNLSRILIEKEKGDGSKSLVIHRDRGVLTSVDDDDDEDNDDDDDNDNEAQDKNVASKREQASTVLLDEHRSVERTVSDSVKTVQTELPNRDVEINGTATTSGSTDCLSKWQGSKVVAPSSSDLVRDCKGVQSHVESVRVEGNDSTRILKALRNTPGLSISIATKVQAAETSRGSVVRARPVKAHSSSSTPNTDVSTNNGEDVGKSISIGSVESAAVERRSTGRISPRNLRGLSITIPSYQYRAKSTSSITISPAKRHMDSPESTVHFPKVESYPGKVRLSLENILKEEEEQEEEEEEDDCDSQVLEDLRKQNDVSYKVKNRKPGELDQMDEQLVEDPKIYGALQIAQNGPLSQQNRCNEAVAKSNRLQDLEHFDEQVLEDLRTQGTVVSPQPSGIPCSPASRRPSSAYLERLLPSPPCSVSCSEDAKNDLTLKGILASPSRLDSRSLECEKPRLQEACRSGDKGPSPSSHVREADPLTAQDPKNVSYERSGQRGSSGSGGTSVPDRLDQASTGRFYGQEIRNSGRPMSSGNIHSTYYPEYISPKRPMSAEWAVARQRTQRSMIPASSTKGTRRSRGAYLSNGTGKIQQDPATQLRDLIKMSGHLIPDPLLVPRDHLPALAAAPSTEIPKLLVSRPELRLPEALTRPELLRDPDLLVISLAHLQHVLDHGEGPVSRAQVHPRNNRTCNGNGTRGHVRPKLSCKPIGTLMPAPIDLSSNRRTNPYPPLLRVRSGLLKQEQEVTSTASSPDDSQLWHPLFGSQKRQQQQHHASWHRTTLAS